MSEPKHSTTLDFNPDCSCSFCADTARYLHEKHLGPIEQPAPSPAECKDDPLSSRMCEHGTKACTTQHAPAPAEHHESVSDHLAGKVEVVPADSPDMSVASARERAGVADGLITRSASRPVDHTAPGLTDAELDAMEQRANAATPGPWDVVPGNSYNAYPSVVLEAGKNERVLIMFDAEDGVPAEMPGTDEDATFVAHSRTDVPRLVSAYRALQAERCAYCKHVTEVRIAVQKERDEARADAAESRAYITEQEEAYESNLNDFRGERDRLRAEVKRLKEALTEIERDEHPRATKESPAMEAVRKLREERDAAKAALARAVELLRDVAESCEHAHSGECMAMRAEAFIAEHGAKQ